MKINGKIFALAVTTLTATALSVWVMMWASEAFFFDRFYYQKSVQHGYWVPNKYLSPRDFGKRGQDIANLSDFIQNPQHNTLGAQTDKNIFTIAVFGDSFVWGQGIKEQDRFVNILENKLNKVRPTKVLSLANSGDGALDSYIKYLYIRENKKIDLFLFTVVNNDLLLQQNNRYNDAIQQQLVAACKKSIIIDPKETAVSGVDYYHTNIRTYDDQYGNLCVFKSVIDRFPNHRALYFYYGKPFWRGYSSKTILSEYRRRGLVLFSADNRLVNEQTKRYFVSTKEGHPSALANKLFSDAIYDEIIKMDYFYR